MNDQGLAQCPHCGSCKDPWFSRVVPMSYHCQDCAKDVNDEQKLTMKNKTEQLDRPAPEADAAERMAWAGEYMVPTEVARRLERERDEAKRRCLRWLEEWHLTDKVRCDMKSERDEARGAWYEMHSRFERSKTEAEQLIRERDEARKEVEYYKARYEQLKEGAK